MCDGVSLFEGFQGGYKSTLDYRVEVFAPEGGEVMVKQSMAAECDINNIVQKWIRSGELPAAFAEPRYGDFSSGMDFMAALQAVDQAEEQFAALPARVRERCGNDPANFLDMCLDESRRAELLELGLVEEQLAPVPVPGAPPTQITT